MTEIKNVFDYLDAKAPCSLKMDFDNVGLLVGSGAAEVDKILLSLDITHEVIAEAIDLGAQLIVSHHPIMFSAKTAADTDSIGKKLVSLLSHGIGAICMHTNLDAAADGVNDALAKKLGLRNITQLRPDGVDYLGREYGIGRVGELEKSMELSVFLSHVKNALNCNGLRYVYGGRDIRRVAVGGGSCSDYLKDAAAKGCDAFVTADIKYDTFIAARDMGITMIDADHFCTENVVIPVLRSWLSEGFPECEVVISKAHGQTTQFYV